jgi:hypothetical protein
VGPFAATVGRSFEIHKAFTRPPRSRDDEGQIAGAVIELIEKWEE